MSDHGGRALGQCELEVDRVARSSLFLQKALLVMTPRTFVFDQYIDIDYLLQLVGFSVCDSTGVGSGGLMVGLCGMTLSLRQHVPVFVNP